MDAQQTMGTDPLRGRSFLATSVLGVPALTAPTAVLTFDADGTVSGRATVNRVRGSYEVEDGVLRCGPLASTMMAGPPEAMEQELRLLEALGRPAQVRGVDGGVELVDADGPVTTLREVDGEVELL